MVVNTGLYLGIKHIHVSIIRVISHWPVKLLIELHKLPIEMGSLFFQEKKIQQLLSALFKLLLAL